MNYSLIRTPLAALWPSRLRHQMLVLLVAVMLVAMCALYAVSSQRAADAAFQTSSQWAGALARTAAGAAAPLLVKADDSGLEKSLRDIARLPGVLRIDVRDSGGVALLSLRALADGSIIARNLPPDMPQPPAGAHGSVHAVQVAGIDALQVWAPVDPIMPLGHIGVLFSQHGEREQLMKMQRELVGAIALVGLLTIAAVYTFLMRSLAPLQRVVRFSRSLGDQVGLTLQQQGNSREVAELTEALNHASLTLQQQLVSIRDNEARVHSLLDATPDAILGLDAQACIVMLNPAASSIFGVEPEQVVGQPLASLLPALPLDEIDRITREGMLIRASRMARLDSSALRRDGTEFPVEVAISRVEDEHGTRYTCVVRDVTDQRWVDSMLRLYNRALECATNGVVISDVRVPGQPIFYANPAFEKITGYSASDAIGRNCAFLQGEDREQPEIAALREAVRQGQPATVVLRNYRKDGTLFFNELSIAPVAAPDGEVTHYVGVQSDVTERERARFALAERSARLNAVFDLSPDGFVVFDREGQMVYCNQAFVQMTGWDASQGCDIVGFDRQFVALCNPAQAYVPVAASVGVAGTHADTLELLRPERRTLARLARLNLGGHGESILYFRDVTHETEVDRMKSEFLTTAAHELRTPMASIFGFAELMLKRPVPPDRQRDVMETIHRQASLLINMVNELLDLARIEARQGKDFRITEHALGPLIDETVGALMIHGDPRKVEVRAEHGDARLMVDHDKTRQAITNVLSNAYKYSPGGGSIRLHTQLREVDGQQQVGVSVTDSGIGMTPAQKARLFERFYRADPSGNIPGTGLGMCLVEEIMELQGGQIEVDSEPGIGTRVTLWFPVVAQPAAVPA
ncbi:PAS domain S-box protein [Piscinibacter sp.]|uniref:PAS domain S-box protein n=1 Tax=Piscinibacter sp. TaxID=1903157 RepID=UPI0025D5C216|nr:PAS domain S-box protein [Piscinibacter sp.]